MITSLFGVIKKSFPTLLDVVVSLYASLLIIGWYALSILPFRVPNWLSWFLYRILSGIFPLKDILLWWCSSHSLQTILSSLSLLRRCLTMTPEAMPNLSFYDHLHPHWGRIYRQSVPLRFLSPYLICDVYFKGTDQSNDVVGIDMFVQTTFGTFAGVCTVYLWRFIRRSLYCRVQFVLGHFRCLRDIVESSLIS